MSGAPFGPDARLRQASEFRAVFRRGRKFVRPGFVLIAASGPRSEARLGLALAKRRIAKSVDRNRVKRVIRESFRYARASLGAVDIVVLARSRTGGLPNAELFRQLEALWPEVAAWAAARIGDRPAVARTAKKSDV